MFTLQCQHSLSLIQAGLRFKPRPLLVRHAHSSASNKKGDSSSSSSSSSRLRTLFASSGPPPSSRAECAKLLADSVVFFDPEETKSKGLVAINKPCGLGLKSGPDSPVGLEDVLPDLANHLGVEKLYVIKTIERYSSGLALLGSQPDTGQHVERSLARRIHHAVLAERYLALTNGFPRISGTTELVDTILQEIDARAPVVGKVNKELVIMRGKLSKKVLKSGVNRPKRVLVHTEAVARSSKGRAAMVSLDPTYVQNHFIHAYLADLLCPLIGDMLYSYRAKEFMGSHVKVGIESSPTMQQQALPEWMLKALQLRAGEEHLLPKQLHLFRRNLPGFIDKNTDLTLYAPPPEHMLAMAQALGIKVDVKTLMEEDVIRDRPKKAKQGAEKRKEDEKGYVDVTHTVAV